MSDLAAAKWPCGSKGVTIMGLQEGNCGLQICWPVSGQLECMLDAGLTDGSFILALQSYGADSKLMLACLCAHALAGL